MRLRVSGPVSSIFCLPTRPHFGWSVGSSVSVAQVCSVPRGANICLNFADSSAVRSFGLICPG